METIRTVKIWADYIFKLYGIIANTVSNSNQDFVNEMNIYVKKLGYKNFNFNSASGLDYE